MDAKKRSGSTGRLSHASAPSLQEALPEAFIKERSKGMWRLSFVGMALTVMNVMVSYTSGFNARVVNDTWVGVGIFAGFALCAWCAARERLTEALIVAPLGLMVPIMVGDLVYGEFTERLLYLLLAVAIAGFGLNVRALVSFYVMALCGLGLMVGVMPGETRLGPPGFPSMVLDIVVILTGATALFAMNGKVTRAALIEAQHKHHESEQQRKIAEQAASQAEVSNNSKSMFLANVSHELRTPLNAILGYVELIQEESFDEGKAWYDEELVCVHGAAHQLLGLINDVLDLSKIEAGRLQIVPVEFEMMTFIQELQDIISPLAAMQGNTFTWHGVEDVGGVYTDRMRLRQVVLNLLSNAVKFTEQGEVVCEVKRVEDVSGDLLCIEVRDTGIGMSEAQQERIFEPFLQGSAETSHHYGGTGLGLALSRRICGMLGGDIMVESVEGEGSMFRVQIPCVWQAAQVEGAAMGYENRGIKDTI